MAGGEPGQDGGAGWGCTSAPGMGTETRKAPSLPSALPLHRGEDIWREGLGLASLPPRSGRRSSREPSPRGCELRTGVRGTRLSHSSPILAGAGLRIVRQGLIPSTSVAASPPAPQIHWDAAPHREQVPRQGWQGDATHLPTSKSYHLPQITPRCSPWGRTVAGAAGNPPVSNTSAGERARSTPLRGMQQGKGLQM